MFITSHPAKSHNLLDNLGSVYRSGRPSRYIVAVHLLSLVGAQLRQLRTWNLKTWTLLLVHLFIQQTLRADWVQALSGRSVPDLGASLQSCTFCRGDTGSHGEGPADTLKTSIME